VVHYYWLLRVRVQTGDRIEDSLSMLVLSKKSLVEGEEP
jgi:hypothetical protein